mgnify:CR=1 FL=1
MNAHQDPLTRRWRRRLITIPLVFLAGLLALATLPVWVPVLAIASHIPSSEIGSTYFQETHPQELFRECSDYCELISDPAQFPWVLETAMRTAVEKRGVLARQRRQLPAAALRSTW